MNDQFDYVMAPVSIVVGLAIGHILAALGVAVNRLRGHGKPIRLDVVYLAWVGFLMVWIVSFWWWEYKFHELHTTWTYGLYLFVLLYAMTLFFLAVLLVPRGMRDLDDSYAWFMADRRWFFATIVFAMVIDISTRGSRAWNGPSDRGTCSGSQRCWSGRSSACVRKTAAYSRSWQLRCSCTR